MGGLAFLALLVGSVLCFSFSRRSGHSRRSSGFSCFFGGIRVGTRRDRGEARDSNDDHDHNTLSPSFVSNTRVHFQAGLSNMNTIISQTSISNEEQLLSSVHENDVPVPANSQLQVGLGFNHNHGSGISTSSRPGSSMRSTDDPDQAYMYANGFYGATHSPMVEKVRRAGGTNEHENRATLSSARMSQYVSSSLSSPSPLPSPLLSPLPLASPPPYEVPPPTYAKTNENARIGHVSMPSHVYYLTAPSEVVQLSATTTTRASEWSDSTASAMVSDTATLRAPQ